MLLDEMDCVAMTDVNGKYIYKNLLWHERRLQLGQDPGTEYPWLMLEDSAVHEVLRTCKKVIGRLLKSGDTTRCVNYYPISKDGEFLEILIWTIFTGQGTVQAFVDQVGQLTKELQIAKKVNRTLAAASYGIPNIVGKSNVIFELKEQIARVALTNSNSFAISSGFSGTVGACSLVVPAPKRAADIISLFIFPPMILLQNSDNST